MLLCCNSMLNNTAKRCFQVRKVNALTQKRRLFCSNKRTLVYRLPIDFFYMGDFKYSFLGKITGQRKRMSLPRMTRSSW